MQYRDQLENLNENSIWHKIVQASGLYAIVEFMNSLNMMLRRGRISLFWSTNLNPSRTKKQQP